jgi:N-acetylneuraminate synthase
MAHRAGVEVVKHQTHIVEDEWAGLPKVIPGMYSSIYEIMERCLFNEVDELALKKSM